MPINIAVDGPAGAGKSTISRGAAKELGFIYVDTGALYRAIGLHALRLCIDSKDAEKVSASLAEIKVELKFADGEQRVYLNGEDVSDAIRAPQASMAASNVSAVPAVRSFLFDLQRDIAAKNDCIMDGRDIGTVVLPWAQIKIFLTATPEERAMRRYKELTAKGVAAQYEQVLEEMKQRDFNDSNRAIAPLKPAEDSLTVDTTGLDLKESIDLVITLIKERLS